MQATGINLGAFNATRRPLVAVATDTADGVHVELSPARLGGIKLSDNLGELFAAWRGWLLELPSPVGVDLALDVAGLGKDAALVWELTHRPIDFAFYGDAPVTDRIGEFGTRFRAMLAATDFADRFIEACPRATIELLAFKGQYVGGAAHHGHSGWKADDKNQRNDKLMAKILSELGVNPLPGAEKFSSDELDATLCALTALAKARGAGLLEARELDAEITQRCARRAGAPENPAHKAPRNVAVLAQPYWATLNVSRRA